MEDDIFWFNSPNSITQGMEKLQNAFQYISFAMGIFDAWARKNKLNLSDMKILHGLRYQHCTRQCDFIKKYHLSRTTVNTAVIKMASKSLVVINPKDKTITLTDKGISEADKIESCFREIVTNIDNRYPSQAKDKINALNTGLIVFVEGVTGKHMQKDKKSP